jgi:hypothetical protein
MRFNKVATAEKAAARESWPAGAKAEAGGKALYLYCLVPAEKLRSLKTLKSAAAAGPPLKAERFQDLGAILSDVAREEFCGPQAEDRLRDPAWLAPWLGCHQETIARLMRRSPVLPVPFGTLFSSRESLAHLVERHRRVIRDFFQWVAGQEEWAVKVFLDRSRAGDRLFALARRTLAAELAALSPGARYFREQRLREEMAMEVRRRLQGAAAEALAHIQKSATAFRHRPLLSREISGRPDEMLANWAFLVARAELPNFRRRLNWASRRGASLGLTITASGPWAPFSFAPTLTAD